jgi:hypothetical protein
MRFYIGQRVVCVGGRATSRSPAFWKAWREQHKIIIPQRGIVYTIRDTRMAKDGTQRARLMEIINPAVPFTDAPDQEPWFQSASFRPVVERKTDISIFTRMLTPEKERV